AEALRPDASLPRRRVRPDPRVSRKLPLLSRVPEWSRGGRTARAAASAATRLHRNFPKARRVYRRPHSRPWRALMTLLPPDPLKALALSLRSVTSLWRRQQVPA